MTSKQPTPSAEERILNQLTKDFSPYDRMSAKELLQSYRKEVIDEVSKELIEKMKKRYKKIEELKTMGQFF